MGGANPCHVIESFIISPLMATENSPLFSGPGRRSRFGNEVNGFTPSETSNSSTESNRPLSNKKVRYMSNDECS